MTRFVVDAGAVLHLAGEGVEVSGEHELLAPTLLRSQTLSALHEAVQRGEIPADVARDRLEHIWRMKISSGTGCLTTAEAKEPSPGYPGTCTHSVSRAGKSWAKVLTRTELRHKKRPRFRGLSSSGAGF